MSKYILLLGLGKVSFNKTSRNGFKVAKAGHKSEGRMGLMADSYDSERGGHNSTEHPISIDIFCLIG